MPQLDVLLKMQCFLFTDKEFTLLDSSVLGVKSQVVDVVRVTFPVDQGMTSKLKKASPHVWLASNHTAVQITFKMARAFTFKGNVYNIDTY